MPSHEDKSDPNEINRIKIGTIRFSDKNALPGSPESLPRIMRVIFFVLTKLIHCLPRAIRGTIAKRFQVAVWVNGLVNNCITRCPPNAPAWACSTNKLWSAILKADSKRYRKLARQIVCKLPTSLGKEESTELVSAYADSIVEEYNLPVTYTINQSMAGKYHAHLYLPTRFIVTNGMGRKAPDWDQPTKAHRIVQWLRTTWANLLKSTERNQS